MVVIERNTVSSGFQRQQAQPAQFVRLASALGDFVLDHGRLPCPAQASLSPDDPDVTAYYGNEISLYGGSGCESAATPANDPLDKNANPRYWEGVEILNGTKMIRGMVPFKRSIN